jgi:hypothetical protein
MEKLLVFVMKALVCIVVFVAVLVAILLGINAYFVRRNGARLDAQIAELRATGEPVTLTDLARPPIPSERNAATFLRPAESDIRSIRHEIFEYERKLNESEMQKLWQEGLYSEHDSEKERSIMMRSFLGDARQFNPAERAMAQEIFDAHPNAIPLLEQAAACPDYDPQYDFGAPDSDERVLKRVQYHRAVTHVLQMKKSLLLSEDRREDALACMILLLRLSRHFEHDSGVCGFLVAVGIRGVAIWEANNLLQSGPISRAGREALERELSQHDAVQAYIGALTAGRAMELDAPFPWGWWRSWFLGGVAYGWKSYCIDLTRDYLAAAPLPYRDAQVVQLRARPSPFLFVQSPYSLDVVRVALEHDRAMVRALRVLNAVQVKAAPDAKEPPKLSDLGLPPEVTVDPFDGKPLRVKKLPQGWLVYSVGKNLIDDGGNLDSWADIGVGPPGCEKKAERKQ